jgi:hypothetical protein
MGDHNQQQPLLAQAQAREVPLKPDPHSGDLSAQKNQPGQLNRKVITERSFAGMVVRALLRSVQYRTSTDGKPLCLAAFEVLFIYDNSTFRFKSADVIVSFTKTPDNLIVGLPASVLTPVVVQNFCPRRVYGLPSSEEHKWTYHIDMVANFTLPPVQTSIAPSINRETSYMRDHRMEIRGLPIKSNTVKWTLFENAKQQKGIPDRFTCAVLLEHDGTPFQAEVRVSVRASVAVLSLPLAFNAQPWSKDDPVLFQPGAEFAAKVPPQHLSQMKEADWLLLVDLPKEYDVRKIVVCLPNINSTTIQNEITYK